jgi:hypothetical protein
VERNQAHRMKKGKRILRVSDRDFIDRDRFYIVQGYLRTAASDLLKAENFLEVPRSEMQKKIAKRLDHIGMLLAHIHFNL